MSVFPDWQRYAVTQRDCETGCIPTSYEMILRARGIKGVNLDTFQDDFDLGPASNHFGSVADAVRLRYPHVDFQWVDFPDGKSKLEFVEDRLSRKEFTIISLANSPDGSQGWHIMPIVDMDSDDLCMLKYKHLNSTCDIERVPKSEFVRRHDEWPGGKEVAFLADQPGSVDGK